MVTAASCFSHWMLSWRSFSFIAWMLSVELFFAVEIFFAVEMLSVEIFFAVEILSAVVVFVC